MDGAAGFNLATIAGKTGALGDLISGSLNKWNGDPELLDDMNDRTYATTHPTSDVILTYTYIHT